MSDCIKMADLRLFASYFLFGGLLAFGSVAFARADEGLPVLEELEIRSTADGSLQKVRLWAPPSARSKATPLLVFLHSWSGDYRQNNAQWQREAVARGWIYLHPNFRGPNNRPEACGSTLARQDVLDALDHVLATYQVDRSRVYLAGSSGGGHMAMLMAGYFPQRFSAVSAWVGISDLAEWHRFHTRTGTPTNYAKMLVASCGGAPGASPEVDAEYRARSPLFHLHRVGDLPLDLSAGVNDGHTGSVPIAHTLRAFNVIAKAGGHSPVAPREIEELSTNRRLSQPAASDTVDDATYGRAILLRRSAGKSRVTIFDGGHEGLAAAGCAWLASQQRPTTATTSEAKPRPSE